MNIQTTQRTAKLATATLKDSAAPAATKEEATSKAGAAPQESFQAEGEGRGSAAWRGGIRKGVSWGEKLQKPIGGMTAVAMLAGGGLALSLGGAMVGGLVGGSFGPTVAALQGGGIGGFFSNSFSNLGTAVKIGSAIGGTAGAVGGLALGINVGGTVAKAAAFPVGFAVGALQGAAKPGSGPPPVSSQDNDSPEFKTEHRGLIHTTGVLGAGIGLLSGASGGFVTGATLMAAGSLVTDAVSGDFSFGNFVSQLGSKAMLGGAIGGAGGALLGFYGGEMAFGTIPQLAVNKFGGASRIDIQDKVEKKEIALNERANGLDTQASQLETETAAYREQHAEASAALVKREDQMKQNEDVLSGELNTIDTRIEKNAQADYDKRSATPDPSIDAKGDHGVIGERKTLDAWDSKLNGWQGDLNNFRSELIGWEKKLDNKIDVEAGAIFGEERKPIDKNFSGLHGQLDNFESKLNKYEVDINNRIQNRYESGMASEKPGVMSDLRDARREKERSESELRDARSEKDSAESRHNAARRQRSNAESRLRSAQNDESSLRSRIRNLNSRISSLQSQLSSCRSSL